MHFFSDKASQYQSLDSSEDGRDSTCEREVPKKRDGISRLALLAIIFIAQAMVLASTNAAAFAFGKMRAEKSLETTLHAMRNKAGVIGDSTIRTQPTLLEFNRTYAERPSSETDAAWTAIFPPHGGFFKDNEIAPTGASLAVYHQLHCLDAIRHAYYVLLDAVHDGHNVTMSELEDYSTDWHTRHCIDFLRQMLMCNADLHLEPVDPKLGGITGFGDGREHQCVVWEDVRDWSIRHQA